jgi:uncharacterized protein (DUF983 family)
MNDAKIGSGRRIARSLRLRCPRCGEGRLFAGLLKMNDRCDACDLDFGREPGFYLGSIYVNYGMTALIVTAIYIAALAQGFGRSRALLWGTAAFCVVFPLWFFRYARSLWLGMDQYVDRDSGDSSHRRERGGAMGELQINVQPRKAGDADR